MAASNKFFVAIPYNNDGIRPTQLNDGEYVGTENTQLSQFLDEIFYYAGNAYVLCVVDESGYVDRSDINYNSFFLHDDNTILTNELDTTPLNTGTHIWRRNNIAVQTKTIDSSSPYVGTVVESGGDYEVYIFGDYTTKTESPTAATWGTVSSQYSASYYISVPNNGVNDNIHPQQTYSMIAGHTYTFNMYANSEANYDGVILSQTPITSWSGSFSSMGVARCSGSNTSGTYTVSPSSNGTMYIYFRTDSGTISSNCYGRVDIIDTEPSDSEAAEWYKDNSPGCDDSYRIVVDNDEVNNDIHPVVQYPVTAGNTYRFDMETHSEIFCDGIILSYSPITYWNDSFSDMGDARCSGPYETETEIYTPTTNGIVYIYFKTNESNILYDGTTCYGKVNITISRKNTISYSVNSPSSQYCSYDPGVRSTTDGQRTFIIASSAASCLSGSVTCTLYSVKNSSGVAQSGWTLSSNGRYIYVPSGKAAGKYTCTITASSATGSGYVGETVTRTCQITIVAVVVDHYEEIFDNSAYIPEDPDEPVGVVEHIVPNGTLLPASACTVTISNINNYVDFDWEDEYVYFPFSQATVYNNGTSEVFNSPSDFTIYWTGEPQTFSTKGCTVDDYPAIFTSIFECYIYGRGNKSLLVGAVTDLPREKNVVTNSNYSPSDYTVSVTIGSGLTAGDSSATVAANASHKAYDYYTSGSYNNQHNVTDSVTWRITSQTFKGDSALAITRFSKSGNTLYHSSMGTNFGTDIVEVTAVNESSSSTTATAKNSIDNVITNLDYNASDSDYTVSVSIIDSGLNAGESEAKVRVSGSHTHKYYYLYTSGSTSGPYTSTQSDSPTWSIASQYIDSSSNAITRFSKDGNKLKHATMGETLGTDYVTIFASNNSATDTASTNVTNTRWDTNPSGYWASISITNKSGITCAGGSSYVSASAGHSAKYTYTSGSVSSDTHSVSDGVTWRITTNGNSRFSKSGNTLYHSSMTTNVTTDTVVVTAVNDNSSSATATDTASISNTITNSNYNPSGYWASIGINSGLTAAGGRVNVLVSAGHDAYNKYTSGSVDETTHPMSDNANWDIASQTFTPVGGSASTITRFSKSGNTLSHSSMGTYVGTDKVIVTAINNTSGTTGDTETSISNTVTSITILDDGTVISGTTQYINYNQIKDKITVSATYTSGSTADVTNSLTIGATTGNYINSNPTGIVTIS